MNKKEKEKIKKIVLGVVFGFLALRLLFYGANIFQDVPLKVCLASAFFALVPVIVWAKFVYFKRLENLKTKKQKRRELLLLLVIFVLGTLTVPLLTIYYDYIAATPAVDYYRGLADMIIGPKYEALQMFTPGTPEYDVQYELMRKAEAVYNTVTIVIDAWLEEIVKLSLLIIFIRVMKIVNTIGDAVTFSVLAGLGFAFIENIIFFTDVYLDPTKNNQIFINVVIFRTIVLSIGHMIFSGIFGYFYGLSKFGLPVYEEQRWEGKKFPLATLLHNTFGIPMHKAYSVLLFIEGMMLAMLTHATFNSFLGFGIRDYAVYLILISAIYVYYLTQRKAGHMVLASLGKKRMSLMAPKDEDVVLELAGMWINEGKYKEVEEICERLEQKDPDNAVVKLLYARAHDKRRVKRAKLALASLFFQEDIFEDDVSIFEKWKQIRAEREAKAKGVDPNIANDLSPHESGMDEKTKKK